MNLSDIISALQTELTNLQNLAASQPQYTQADIDAANKNGAASVTPQDPSLIFSQADLDAAKASGVAQEKATVQADLAAVNTEVSS